MLKNLIKKVVAIILLSIVFLSEISFAADVNKNDINEVNSDAYVEAGEEKDDEIVDNSVDGQNNNELKNSDENDSEIINDEYSLDEMNNDSKKDEEVPEKIEINSEEREDYKSEDEKIVEDDVKKLQKNIKSEKNGENVNIENYSIRSTMTAVTQAQQERLNILEDGLYEIEVGTNSTCVIDVVNSAKYGGANIQIQKKNNAESQKVLITHVGDGYYTIQFKHSEMLLDVYYAKTDNGTNVWQCGRNGADAQKWLIHEVENGYYNIISKCGNKYLTVHNGSAANGTNIEIYDKKYGSDQSQMFRFKKVEPIVGKKTIDDGLYEIEIAADSNKVLDVKGSSLLSGANVHIFTKNNENCQRAKVKYVGDGCYTFEFVHSGRYLDVANAETIDGTNVWQCTKNGSDAQKWIIKDVGNGYYNIISKCSNTYLTVENGNTINRTNIEINTYKNNASQKFKFNKIDPIAGTKTIDDGLYEIEIAADSSKVLDVKGSSQLSGANVHIFTENSENCQRVNIKYMGEGYYTIQFKHSGKFLDVANAGKTNGTNVWQCTENESDAQKWIIKDVGNGYYNIISKCSEKYLTVYNNGTADRTNIEINSKKNNSSQKFRFVKMNTKLSGEKTIADGTYEIELALDSTKVLEVKDASIVAGANVQINKNNGFMNQKVDIKCSEDGYYTIQFKHSKKFLDVYYAKASNGTNVWQCSSNGADAQKWVIKDLGNGYCNIISKCNMKYLTVHNGSSANGANIEIHYKSSDEKSQMFKFKKVEKITGTKTIENGTYVIESALNSNKVLDIVGAGINSGANVQLYDKNKSLCQKVIVEYIGDGYYEMQFKHSGKYLDVSNADIHDGTNVWQCNKNNSDAQKWIIKETDDGYYNIISKCSNTYLTIENGNTANGTNIQIYSNKNNKSQKFRFKNPEQIVGTKTINDGIYEIETAVSNTKVIEVVDGLKSSGANVQIFTRNMAKCQKVEAKYQGDGYYTLEFVHSGMHLDVSNAGKADGTNVWQCYKNGADAQKWIIKDAGDGYYNIISKCSETYLTVAGGKSADKTNIVVNRFVNNASQKFKFKVSKNILGIDVSSHQGNIDWQKVKTSEVDFAIIRCGYGQDMTSQDDSKFARNISECERLNIPYGVYIYSYALNEESAVSEANHVIRLIRGHNPVMGIWFDMEDADGYKSRNGMPSNDMLVKICLKFCKTMENNGYSNVGIYASLNWMNNQLNDSRLDKYDKWVAQWNSTCTYRKKHIMWQYTDKGSVPGISGCVDMNKYLP